MGIAVRDIIAFSDARANLSRLVDEVQKGAEKPTAVPVRNSGVTGKQYWHARYHHDATCRWLRGVCADFFMESAQPAIDLVAPQKLQRQAT